MDAKDEPQSSSVAIELEPVQSQSNGIPVTTGKRKSYQMRALVRKTIAYQRRQLVTNICCVSLCPFLLVTICGLLAIILRAIIDARLTPENVQYCSSFANVNDTTLLPGAIYKDESGRSMYPYSPSGRCVSWFADDYFVSLPYSPQVEETLSCTPFTNPSMCPLSTSTLLPTPKYGWLSNPLQSAEIAAITMLNAVGSQLHYWGVVSAPPSMSFIGSRPAADPFSVSSPDQPAKGSGLLGDFPVDYYIMTPDGPTYTPNPTVEQLPYFHNVDGGEQAVNSYLADQLSRIITEIASLPPLPRGEPVDSDFTKNYSLSVQELLRQVPSGALIFLEGDLDSPLEYILQVGTNRRLQRTSSNNMTSGGLTWLVPYPGIPSEGFRRLQKQAFLSQAIANSMTRSGSHNFTIAQGLRQMPQNDTTGFSIAVGSLVGTILYPFGVSFLLPIFVITLVKEKEERILIMMKMNGLKLWVYYLTEYVHFYVLHIITIAIFIATGFIFQLEFFTLTNPGVYIILFFLWGHVQIAMAFLLSTFFSKSRTALIVVFLLVLAGVIIDLAVGQIFTGNTPWPYLLYPPFAFYRGLNRINDASSDQNIPDYKISDLIPGDLVFSSMMYMLVETFVIGIVAMYLQNVLPSEFGVRKPWHFPVTDLYKWIQKKRGQSIKNGDPLELEAILDTANEEDDDVRAERDRVLNNQYDPNCPVVIKDMRKAFGPFKIAVKSISLAIEPNLVFGLLGPNGAGKTTLINILTGLYEASSGVGFLAGHRVGEEMDQIYMNIGVCPQHDILWDDLSVEDHLYFYARLKGISPAEEDEAVNQALQTVSLTKFRTRPSKGLSGGEKRRLSIAIALIGRGKVIFLDEPTTGLDPEVRRLVWNIIQEQRNGRTIILTTHSMEEAEVLCQRIGIMAKGTLRCIGPQVRLKNKYGSGFKLTFNCLAHDNERACNYVESLLPSGFVRIDSFATNVTYQFERVEGAITRLFDDLGNHAEENGILDWGVSQTTLEEVFLQIIKEADAEAD